jgi:hypothetical protein
VKADEAVNPPIARGYSDVLYTLMGQSGREVCPSDQTYLDKRIPVYMTVHLGAGLVLSFSHQSMSQMYLPKPLTPFILISFFKPLAGVAPVFSSHNVHLTSGRTSAIDSITFRHDEMVELLSVDSSDTCLTGI